MKLDSTETALVALALDAFLPAQMRAWKVAREAGLEPSNFNIPQAIELLYKTEEGLLSQIASLSQITSDLLARIEGGMALPEAILAALEHEDRQAKVV